jgi:hypothetical protein
LRTVILGNTLTGKGTIAALIALQLAKIRALKKARPLAVLTRPTTSYRPFPVDTARSRTLGGIITHLHSAGAPLILDDATEAYALVVAAWRDQSSEHRDRAGLPRKARLNPEEWGIINAKFGSIFTAASEASIDFLEIHRQGRIYVPDSDLGLVEGDGVAAAGQAAAGSGDLVILLDGGLRSRHRAAGERILHVLSDASGKLNGAEFRLPHLTGPADLRLLQAKLSTFFAKSLPTLVEWGDAEAREWKSARETEIPDEFSEAQQQAQRAESGVVAAEVAALFAIKGLAGQKAENIQARATLLMDHFGVGDVASLDEVPASLLRAKLPVFRSALELRGAP